MNFKNLTNNTATINEIHLLCLMNSDHTNEHGSWVVVDYVLADLRIFSVHLFRSRIR